MDDPAGCTALVAYSGDVVDENTEGPVALALAGGDQDVASGDQVSPLAQRISAEGGAGAAGAAGSSGALPAVPRFVGLSNQGATCYMNSLLQTLYMTPEVSNDVDPVQYSGDAFPVFHLVRGIF